MAADDTIERAQFSGYSNQRAEPDGSSTASEKAPHVDDDEERAQRIADQDSGVSHKQVCPQRQFCFIHSSLSLYT